LRQKFAVLRGFVPKAAQTSLSSYLAQQDCPAETLLAPDSAHTILLWTPHPSPIAQRTVSI